MFSPPWLLFPSSCCDIFSSAAPHSEVQICFDHHIFLLRMSNLSFLHHVYFSVFLHKRLVFLFDPNSLAVLSDNQPTNPGAPFLFSLHFPSIFLLSLKPLSLQSLAALFHFLCSHRTLQRPVTVPWNRNKKVFKCTLGLEAKLRLGAWKCFGTVSLRWGPTFYVWKHPLW